MSIIGFQNFYSQWLEEEKALIDPLRKLVESQKSNAEITGLVDRCYQHYSKYVDAKIKAAQEDVAYVAAGMWRTPLEAGFLWMGGWRPTTAIVLAYSLMGIQIENELRKLLDGIDVPSMAALSAKQLGKLNTMQQKTRDAEDDISNRLAVLQMLVADQQMARVTSAEPPPSETNDLTEVRETIEPKLVGLRDLLIEAEQLRMQTLREMMGVLTPVQAAQYTVAAFEMAMAVRKLGDQERDMYSRDFLPRVDKTMWELASQGQTWELQEALQTGVDPSAEDHERRTPGHVAASRGNGEGVKQEVLVRSGAETSTYVAGVEVCEASASGAIGYGSNPMGEARNSGSDATLKNLENELERRGSGGSQDSGLESSEESSTPMEGVQGFPKPSSWNENDAGSTC